MIDRTIEQAMDLHAKNHWLKGELLGLQAMCNLRETQLRLMGQRMEQAEKRVRELEGTKQ